MTRFESPCRKCQKRVAGYNEYCHKQDRCKLIKDYRQGATGVVDVQAASDPTDDGYSTFY